MSDPDQILYEMTCDSCGTEYEIYVDSEEKEEPIYCPFCGSDVDIEIDEDEDEEDYDEYDELDFDGNE